MCYTHMVLIVAMEFSTIVSIALLSILHLEDAIPNAFSIVRTVLDSL